MIPARFLLPRRLAQPNVLSTISGSEQSSNIEFGRLLVVVKALDVRPYDARSSIEQLDDHLFVIHC